MNDIDLYINYIAKGIEIVGVITIVIGAALSLTKFIFASQKVKNNAYKTLRHELGKAILLGLEILVAADIIATVVTEPNMDDVLALGVIIIIRILLSFAIEVEIEGKFPWQERNTEE